jgi:NADPH-dependent glutamate synthase beta subunit-like oxidoreductase
MSIQITVDGTRVEAREGATLLEAALAAGVYVPALCAHPDLLPQADTPAVPAIYHGVRRIVHDAAAQGPPGCGLCVVDVEGEGQVAACHTRVRDGQIVSTRGLPLESLRRERLARILTHHPHACLTCAQREGCTREPCSMSVPTRERCCSLLGRCELQAVSEYVGIDPSTPRYVPPDDEPPPTEPLFDRDPSLCIACGRCVRACDQREVHALGWVRDGAGRRWVGPQAETLAASGCRFCGSCVEVCPTGALMDRGVRAADRLHALVPCRAACPAQTNVPRYVHLIAEGRLDEAAAVVAERAPLVEVLGQVCFHPCEAACRRNEVNGAPISICAIKREAGARSATAWHALMPPPVPTGRTMAVVGGGPAGLIAAHVLHALGHAVTLFEARAEVGGMLTSAIPPFRLSREVARREAEVLLAGIEVRTGVRVGSEDSPLADLSRAYDAVVLAPGAPASSRLAVEGEGYFQVCPGLDVLSAVAERGERAKAYGGQRVVVIGGGNVAMDCARTALRLGAVRVDVVCLEQPAEMPAYAPEIRLAAGEGVQFHHGWGVRAFHGNGTLGGVDLKRCTRVFDGAGRFAPEYDESETRTLEADAAMVAIGQQIDRSLMREPLANVFAAGDYATGPRSVVEAIASGRQAALAADRHAGGRGEWDIVLGPTAARPTLGRDEGFAARPRLEPACHSSDGPADPWMLPPGLGAADAQREAARCLRCDLRLAYRAPLRPPVRRARLVFDPTIVAEVPECEGVLRFYDEAGEILAIVGGPNVREELASRLAGGRAATFDVEACAMYTQRQNELLSLFIEAHGRMPAGVSAEESLDDLF